MNFINVWLRRRRIKKLPLCGSLQLILSTVILALLFPPALAQASVTESLAALTIPGFEWEAQQTMQLSGVPMYVRRFSSNDAVIPAAQALAQHSGLFERILKLNSKVVLSGLRSDWHWLAEVDTSTSGSQGYVSALHVEVDGLAQGRYAAKSSFIWLPPQARQQFDHQSTLGNKKVVQQVYSVALPIQTLTSYVRRQLRAEGWAPEPEFAGMGASTVWRRAGARVMLFPQQGASGTSLYVHYSE
ncbi:hypothetical protein [Pollutimonas harenae]|uniref:Uncharacterized protein n=1 Tax=Pollutimonas harenae TaxID=657015 RepID=A0A853H0J5_9BURK|nr:hypothetical protein [Pollutimonas harenae]NYT85852.1 hypothetical protein [Pollutimonas harenae]TEA70909.1 hypothetical protein ERD84_09645 [Pollutimonas harenae]